VPDLGPFRVRFVQDVPVWIASDPARAAGRRAAAAAFVLELTHARLETDYGRLIDLVEWMCGQLRAHEASLFEVAWHRASIAVASRARSRLWLLGEFPRLPHQPERKNRTAAANQPPPSPRHLEHALARFPQDPDLQLAQVVAWLWGRDSEPMRNRATDGESPRATRRPSQLEALITLQALTTDARVGADAHLRAGLVHFSVRSYTEALAAFEQTVARSASPQTRYLGHFMAGRTLEALHRPGDAIDAYEQALAILPAESASIALASLRFALDERAAAIALLQPVLARRSGDADPGRLIGYGSFIHWPDLQAAMRAEIPR
jgi:tetratricopeptide (TPR) repeat protein